jgi:EAL domain-containing protein (putative c-di-GMP-specific phosphodiesterase class I)
VAVNLSARQAESSDLVERVVAALDTAGLPADALHLEITESVLMDKIERSLETMTALRDLGIQLSIDDFGTGYSSLSYLKRLPVATLKIDRSFVDGLGKDPDDTAIVTAIVSLARSLGLRVVAEGVETECQLAELRRLGCDHAQGFLFARPGVPEALWAMPDPYPVAPADE